MSSPEILSDAGSSCKARVPSGIGVIELQCVKGPTGPLGADSSSDAFGSVTSESSSPAMNLVKRP